MRLVLVGTKDVEKEMKYLWREKRTTMKVELGVLQRGGIVYEGVRVVPERACQCDDGDANLVHCHNPHDSRPQGRRLFEGAIAQGDEVPLRMRSMSPQ